MKVCTPAAPVSSTSSAAATNYSSALSMASTPWQKKDHLVHQHCHQASITFHANFRSVMPTKRERAMSTATLFIYLLRLYSTSAEGL